MKTDDRYPPRVHRDDDRRRGRLHHRAPARARRPALRRARATRSTSRSSAPAARAGPTRAPSSRRTTARSSRSPIRRRSGTCRSWYYGGKSGRGPVQAEIEKHYADKTPNLQVRGVRRLPRHAREGEGDRRRPHRHARPPARLRLDPRDEGGQARVLREAADAQHPRGAPRRARREGDGRRDADGQPGPLERGASPDGRVAQGRRDRRRARGARLERQSAKPANERLARRGPCRAARRPQLGPLARPASRTALQRRATPRSSGAGSGTSATAPCPTWGRTTSIPRSTRSASTRRSRWRRRRPSSIPRSTMGSNLVTYQYGARGNRGPLHACTGTTTASGRRRRSASIPTIRGSGSARATTAC